MKRVMFFIGFVAFLMPAKAQYVSDCTVPETLRDHYAMDVADLALKWLYEIQSPDTSLIEIPQYAQEPIWEGLAAIFNRHDIPEIDSIFNVYCVHTSGPVSKVQKGISVKVDTSFSWTLNWITYQITTGIPALDSLLEKYDFYVSNSSPNHGWVDLSTTHAINVIPICSIIRSFPGTIRANPFCFVGDGSSISLELATNERNFVYKLGWGDCYAGCTSKHLWTFKVYPDCSFDFLGVEKYVHDGYDPSLFQNCNLSGPVKPSPELQPLINVYPNPSEERINIRIENSGTVTYEVMDITGRTLINGEFLKEAQISLESLNKGIYFLTLKKDGTLLGTEKVIRR